MACSDFQPRPHFTVDTACLLARVSFDSSASSPPHHAGRAPIARDTAHVVEKKYNEIAQSQGHVTAGPRIRLRVTRFRETSKLNTRVGLVANKVSGRNEWTAYVLRFFSSSSPFQKVKIYHRLTTKPLRREL